jgi:hypothetical protein
LEIHSLFQKKKLDPFARGKRRIPGIANPLKSDGNPGNPMEIQGIRWKSRESDGNPGNPVGIQGIRWKSQEYLVDIYEYTGNVPVSHTQLMTFHLFTILKPIALSK